MKTNWIDFKALRAQLDFAAVLEHYGVEVKRKGEQHMGYCPLPNHNGKRNSPSFSANLKKGIFQCFGCGAKGNILDFAALMEKSDPKDGSALREVAGKLQHRFCPEMGADSGNPKKPVPPKKAEPKDERPVVVNPPLDFELKGLDAEHPYLLNRGFTPETIRHFGLGYCGRGLLKTRVAISLKHSDMVFSVTRPYR
jgi:DNA primase